MRFLITNAALFLCLALPASAENDWCKNLYIAKCASCHAPDGSGENYLGRKFNVGDFRPRVKKMRDERIEELVLNGKGNMPANKKLGAEKLQGLTAYLRALAAGSATQATCPALVTSVDKLYRVNCSSCHGVDGTGSGTLGKKLKVPDLTSALVQKLNDDELTNTITNGRGVMRSFRNTLAPAQVTELVSYVRKFGDSKTTAVTVAPTQERKRATGNQAVSTLVSEPRKPESKSEPPKYEQVTTRTPEAAQKSPTAAAADATPPKVANAAPLKAKSLPSVRQTYAAKCSACHSRDGSGTGIVGRNMKIRSFSSAEVTGQSDEQLADIIKNGRGRMPAYAKKLSSEQISQLLIYIRELAK
jgi:mono/diheme cytochrome c family protein